MNFVSGIAIFFLIWWIVLFAVLPFGVRNSHESGTAVGEGHDAGAPVQAQIMKKALITTGLSCVVFAIVWLLLRWAAVLIG
jgi:predicted secreted protein